MNSRDWSLASFENDGLKVKVGPVSDLGESSTRTVVSKEDTRHG
jgi:hypothetical protein